MNNVNRATSVSLYDSGLKFTTDKYDIEPRNRGIDTIVHVDELAVKVMPSGGITIVTRRTKNDNDEYAITAYSGAYAIARICTTDSDIEQCKQALRSAT